MTARITGPAAAETAAPLEVDVPSFTTVKAPEGGYVLFEVDGAAYTMPDPVPAGQAIAILNVLHGMSDPIDQGAFLLRELVGGAGLAALLKSNVTHEQWKQLVDRVWPRAFGQLEAARSKN